MPFIFSFVFFIIAFLVFGFIIRQFFKVSKFSNKIFSIAEKELDKRLEQAQNPTQHKNPPMVKSYDCPHCKGHIDKLNDISPSGDTKCTFCNKWFNVYQQH
ncbi:MAG: hypothetical protein MK212_12175 [Saprospiraceae bacterium]|nr:hypothetical protein [Saprospiraceae bacterium]